MKFACDLDELEHWLQRLSLELKMGSEWRHVVAVARLCELFAHRVARDKYAPQGQLPRRMQLSTAWLDLQRQVQSRTPSARPNPPAKRVGKLRVIQGGRAQTGSKAR